MLFTTDKEFQKICVVSGIRRGGEWGQNREHKQQQDEIQVSKIPVLIKQARETGDQSVCIYGNGEDILSTGSMKGGLSVSFHTVCANHSHPSCFRQAHCFRSSPLSRHPISVSHLVIFFSFQAGSYFSDKKHISHPHFSCQVSPRFFMSLYSTTLQKSILCFASSLALLQCRLRTRPLGTRSRYSSGALLQGMSHLHIVQVSAPLSGCIVLDQEHLPSSLEFKDIPLVMHPSFLPAFILSVFFSGSSF